ncbi:MAG TPA: 50S ribosomal protein L30 [Blastocatellia bacterium]|nr:50S ribosomal protein L30 [Blastocatellia bacterium]
MAGARKETTRKGAKRKSVEKIKIQWYRSTIGSNSGHKELVRSLGLTKLNQIVERPDTPSTRGMVKKVPHLLRIIE